MSENINRKKPRMPLLAGSIPTCWMGLEWAWRVRWMKVR